MASGGKYSRDEVMELYDLERWSTPSLKGDCRIWVKPGFPKLDQVSHLNTDQHEPTNQIRMAGNRSMHLSLGLLFPPQVGELTEPMVVHDGKVNGISSGRKLRRCAGTLQA
jgi:hypothetical protein